MSQLIRSRRCKALPGKVPENQETYGPPDAKEPWPRLCLTGAERFDLLCPRHLDHPIPCDGPVKGCSRHGLPTSLWQLCEDFTALVWKLIWGPHRQTPAWCPAQLAITGTNGCSVMKYAEWLGAVETLGFDAAIWSSRRTSVKV